MRGGNTLLLFLIHHSLYQVRSQLSHALYQHDAATRVIARLLRERDSARLQVTDLQEKLGKVSTVAASVEAEPGISEELLDKMQGLARELLATRKKRSTEGLTSVAALSTLHCSGSFPLHSSTTPGVLCCDVDASKGGEHVVTGGVDGSVVYFDLKKKKTLAKLQGHMKKVNKVKIHPRDMVLLSASDDKTVRVWSGDAESNQFRCAHVIRCHRAEVTGMSLHPLNDHLASSSRDKSWSFIDMLSGRCIQSFRDLDCNYGVISFHPDGMILGGGGEDGNVHIWDMKGAQWKAALSGHTAPITSLAFSENGYYLATSSKDGTVRLWDLRKSLTFQTINMEADKPANAVTFDKGGHYIAAASGNMTVHHFESRASTAQVVALDDHTDSVTDVAFGPNASFLVSTSMDRTVRYWEPKTHQM
eukprot:GHVT01071654.1.p1 GENE.GHVT01071654.1~~GHVT01071654.1.p1  ORF type:complete len:418 (+),score=39.33 GHVT01071654.1:1380-2633(+)